MRFDLFFFLFYLNQEEDRYKTPQKNEDDSEDSDGSSSGGSPRSTNSVMDVGKVEEIVAKHSIGPTAGRKSKTNPGLRRSLRLTGAR